MSDADPTRRDVLKRGAALGVASVAPAGTVAGDTSEAGEDEAGEDEAGEDEAGEDEAGEAALPAPFDALPTIDDPTDSERRIAGVSFPPEAVPDEGPIPDVHHQHLVYREITVPAWGLEAARWRLRHRLDCDDPDSADTVEELPEWRIEEALMGYAQLREEFRTPDGRDAVDVLRENLHSDDGGQAGE